MDTKEVSPLVQLTMKLFVSPAQMAVRGTISDAHPSDNFARKILSAAAKPSLFSVAKIASEKYKMPIDRVWSYLLEEVAEKSGVSSDIRSGARMVYLISPKLWCWSIAKIIDAHLESIVLDADEAMSVDGVTISMARRGLRLVERWVTGNVSSSSLLGELSILESSVDAGVKVRDVNVAVYKDEPDRLWCAAANRLFSTTMLFAEGFVDGNDDQVMHVTRLMILALLAELDLPVNSGSRKVSAMRLSDELSSLIPNFPIDHLPHADAGAIPGGVAGSAILGAAIGAAVSFIIRRSR
jgi:hypothetical protein